MRHTILQSGFTLLELIVVILIIATIALGIFSIYGPEFISEQEETLSLFEMKQISNAIRAFEKDNPNFNLSQRCTPADATFLVLEDTPTDPAAAPCNIDTTHEDVGNGWNADYRLGWRGPYITKTGNEIADIDTTITFDGNTNGAAGTQLNENVILDPYGHAYYLFDLDDNDAAAASGIAEPRIVSAGSDGIYDGADCDIAEILDTDPDYCSSSDLLCNSPLDSDDIVLCLD
ncbi:MAG: type II secretion system protein [Proteobacteria bacterium]|nr:type II secretion system protein [Pseudomonadota bacterium]